MSDDNTRHSGSRWEPTPAPVPAEDVPAKDTPAVDPADAASGRPVDDGPAAAGPDNADAVASGRPAGDPETERIASPRAWPLLLPAVPLGSSNPSAPRRRNLRRAGLLAAAVAGLLAVGGAGGYAMGHAAAGSHQGAAGLAGAPGEYGHHRGRFGADGGFRRDRGGTVGDGTAPDGAGSPGTGTGRTGTST